MNLSTETQNVRNRAQIFRNAALLRELDRENRDRRYRYSRINNINNNNVRNLHTVDTTGASWALTPGNSDNNNVPEALKYKKLTRNKGKRNLLRTARRTRKYNKN